MANYNFNKDLPLGVDGEQTVINNLINLTKDTKYPAKLIKSNNNNEYDFIIERKNKQTSYEVKTDVFCKPTYDTGNMFVEFECRGKSSGILVSKADYFTTYYKHLNEIWYIKRVTLIKLIKDNENFIRKTTFSGDENSNTKGWLLPRDNYRKFFTVKLINEKT